MEILTKEKYPEFDRFCAAHPGGSFQQSPAWALVKKEWIPEIIVCRDDEGKIKAGMQVLIRKLGIKAMMYACRGPVCDLSDTDALREMAEGVKVLAKKHNAYIFIADPLLDSEDEKSIRRFRRAGFSLREKAPFHDTIQPRYSYMLNWPEGFDEAALLKVMNKKTRYYMNYAGKQGVECRQTGPGGLDDFYSIYSVTGERKHFNIRPKEYFERMMSALGDRCRLFMCYLGDKPLCGGILVTYGKTASWVYGASSDEMRNLCARDFLQKNMMCRAIDSGCRIYDMQGVATDPRDDRELYGVYRFKSKFTGQVVEAAGEFTILFDPIYKKAIDRAMKLRRKLLK